MLNAHLVQVFACWNPQRYPIGTAMTYSFTHVWRITRIGSVFTRRRTWNGLTPVVKNYRFFTMEATDIHD